MRTLLKITKVLLIIIICAELGIGLFIGTKRLQQMRQSEQAAVDIVEEKATANAKLSAQISNQLRLLHEAKVIGESLGVSKRDVCYIQHRGAGIATTSYYQKCYLRYVQGFTAALDKQATATAIADNPYSNLFGERSDRFDGAGVSLCSLFERDYVTTLTYLPVGFVVDETRDFDCRVPNQLQGVWSVEGGVLDTELSVQTYMSFDQATINTNTAQLWLEYDTVYHDEQLGCDATSFIFCNNPRPLPVQAPLKP